MVRVPRCGVGGDKKRSPSANWMVDGVGCGWMNLAAIQNKIAGGCLKLHHENSDS